MSLSSRRFPAYDTIWRGAVLGSVAEALWVADHPASFGQRWEDSTYLLDDEQGLRGGVAFAGNRLVAAFFSADSDRNPMPDEWEALYDIHPFVRGMPQDLLHLAEVRLLPEMDIEYRGEQTPVITAAFWGEGEHLTAAEPWEAVFENGAVLLEVQLMEPEAAISAWQINYAFSSSQAAVLRSLFERRMASQALPVTVEPWERAILIEDGAPGIEKSRALLAAVGIVLP